MPKARTSEKVSDQKYFMPNFVVFNNKHFYIDFTKVKCLIQRSEVLFVFVDKHLCSFVFIQRVLSWIANLDFIHSWINGLLWIQKLRQSWYISQHQKKEIQMSRLYFDLTFNLSFFYLIDRDIFCWDLIYWKSAAFCKY